MNLLSGLEKFGLDQMDTEHLFEEEKKVKKSAPEHSATEEKEVLHFEEEFLLDKSLRCPVCDNVFKTRMVKNGRVKRLEPDRDLRPRFQYIDTNKYDIASCPKCGYTAMNRFFPSVSPVQIKLLREGVQSKFKPSEEQSEPAESYSYETAIERYKLALYNTLVKKGKNSEKAYECLKLSWLYRGWIEEMTAMGTGEEAKIEECKKEEQLYYEQAFEGFMKAISSENFPMCGMDESTVNILMANMAFMLKKYDLASRFVSLILTSKVASRTVKDRAMDLKEEIIQQLRDNK
jgi:hypothetical protein